MIADNRCLMSLIAFPDYFQGTNCVFTCFLRHDKHTGLPNREYHVSVFWYQVDQARPETAQEWRGLPSQSDVFLVKPDKLDIKRHQHGFLFIMHYNKVLGINSIKEVKSKRWSVRTWCCKCIMTLSWRCHLTTQTLLSWSTSVRSQCYLEIASKGISWQHSHKRISIVTWYHIMLSYPCYQVAFCSRCMIKIYFMTLFRSWNFPVLKLNLTWAVCWKREKTSPPYVSQVSLGNLTLGVIFSPRINPYFKFQPLRRVF